MRPCACRIYWRSFRPPAGYRRNRWVRSDVIWRGGKVLGLKIQPRLACDFLSFRLHTPFVLASGILGTSPTLMVRAAHNGAGMVTAKSCGPTPRTGHPNPVAFDF